MRSLRDIAISIADQHAVARWRDFAAAGVTPATIARLIDQGELGSVENQRELMTAAQAKIIEL